MDAFIVLGCHGSRRYGLSMCHGITNPIADLRKLGDESDYILEYLEKHYKIFDKVVENLNEISNIFHFLVKHGIITKHLEGTIYDYIAMHKGCGLYMFVDPIQVGVSDV